MPKIRGFSGNKRDFIHTLRAALTFLMMSVNDKTEHLKCNVHKTQWYTKLRISNFVLH